MKMERYNFNQVNILPDILAPNLDVIFCGSAAGKASMEASAYYAGPGNMFWTILFETGITSCSLSPKEYYLVLNYGVGLTDLNKKQFGSDSELDRELYDTDKLCGVIKEYKPKVLAFNGKKAGSEFMRQVLDLKVKSYGIQEVKYNDVKLSILPSTSGAARRWWDDSHWYDLAQLISKTKY